MATDKAAWPLPSQSRWVRSLLYLGEGLAFGGVLALFLSVMVGLGVDDSAASGRPRISLEATGFAIIFSFVILRGLVFMFIAEENRSPQLDRKAPAHRDWSETRPREHVTLNALLTYVLLLAIAAVLWWWSSVSIVQIQLMLAGLMVFGIALYLYTFSKIEVAE